jgi:hypothetical protein
MQHHRINLFLSRLDEQQRRWYAALQAQSLGEHGVSLMAQISGLDEKTIRRGRAELEQDLQDRPTDQIRLSGGGRHPAEAEKKNLQLDEHLREVIANHIAGDPMSRLKWLRRSLRKMAGKLQEMGHKISHVTVARLLKKWRFSLRRNLKVRSASSNHPDRETQFKIIEGLRVRFYQMDLPVISVDTKKKELIGNFIQNGQKWVEKAEKVNDHDWQSEAEGKAVPYGIYDLATKKGTVYIGDSADTSEFAVSAIVKWWEEEGRWEYPYATELLILADSGGSNGCAVRLWKQQLQEKLSNPFGLKVTVCHYPTGCSKWNPIEHKLFSQISVNWSGEPLRSFELMQGYIAGTTTESGLSVRAELLRGAYAKGLKISDEEMDGLNLELGLVCPKWNYTIQPQLIITSAQRLVATGS